jgi:hypothetical protein
MFVLAKQNHGKKKNICSDSDDFYFLLCGLFQYAITLTAPFFSICNILQLQSPEVLLSESTMLGPVHPQAAQVIECQPFATLQIKTDSNLAFSNFLILIFFLLLCW